MTTTINASLSGGLINSADTSGILQLQTGSTAALTIDASQNVLVGATSTLASEKLNVTSGTNAITGLISATNASQSNDILRINAARNTTNGSYNALAYYNTGASAYKFVVTDGGNISTFGGQITFPATQSASSDANTLDDYEEGTWTPVILPSAGSLTSYTSSGKYVKVGQAVTLSFQISIGTQGTASGTGNLSNLPFQATSPAAGNRVAIGVARENAATGNMYQWYINSGATTGDIITLTNGSIPWSNGYQYIFTITYQSAA